MNLYVRFNGVSPRAYDGFLNNMGNTNEQNTYTYGQWIIRWGWDVRVGVSVGVVSDKGGVGSWRAGAQFGFIIIVVNVYP